MVASQEGFYRDPRPCVSHDHQPTLKRPPTNKRMLLSNCLFRSLWDELKAEGSGTLLQVPYDARFVLPLVIVLPRVDLGCPVLQHTVDGLNQRACHQGQDRALNSTKNGFESVSVRAIPVILS